MSVRYSKHLFIRIDRPMRADLLTAAEAADQSVSAFARSLLQAALIQDPKGKQSLGINDQVRR